MYNTESYNELCMAVMNFKIKALAFGGIPDDEAIEDFCKAFVRSLNGTTADKKSMVDSYMRSERLVDQHLEKLMERAKEEMEEAMNEMPPDQLSALMGGEPPKKDFKMKGHGRR